jgi:cobalt-zinc-cadmium efflux system protein
VGHGHHHHQHAPPEDGRRLVAALVLISALLVAEVVGGLVAHSLALLSDAAHMLTDVAALVLSLYAARVARRPAAGPMTYGFGRAEVLSAQANGAVLGVLGLLIAVEGVRRLANPPHVAGATVVVVAGAGVLVNLAATRILAGGGPRNLNVEGAYQHLLTDLAAFIATLIAGLVVLTTGFSRADPIASLLVALLMVVSAARLLAASGRVVLEAAPAGVDPAEIGRAMAGEPGVVEVHDLHVWEVATGFPAVSAHIVVAPDTDCHATRRALARLLADRYDLAHSTLQVEHAPRPDLVSIERSRR